MKASDGTPAVLDPEEEEEKKEERPARVVTDLNKKGPNPKGGRMPTFLGIDVECDPEFSHKLGLLFKNVFT